MAYATYTTEAVVCGSFDRSSSNRSFLLFTEDAGMLFAEARSVREERSKQRFALQEFSVVRVSLVRGKSGWRIGSVEALGNPFMESDDRETRGEVVRLVRLLRRYIHGEEPHPETYRLVREALAAIGGGTIANRSAFSLLLELNLLYKLGYVSSDQQITPFLTTTVADYDRTLSVSEERQINGRIETASSASQL